MPRILCQDGQFFCPEGHPAFQAVFRPDDSDPEVTADGSLVIPHRDHVTCPVCGSAATREKRSERNPNFVEPIAMYSVAVESLDDIRKIQQECPDIRISDNPADPLYGVPVAKNRHAKMQMLKHAGYTEKN